MTSSALPLTKHNSKGYSKGENKAITPQGTRAATLSLNPNIFNNKVTPIEIDQELKNKSKFKEDGFQGATLEDLLIVINTLEITNKLTILSRLTPLLILEKSVVLKRQAINFNIL